MLIITKISMSAVNAVYVLIIIKQLILLAKQLMINLTYVLQFYLVYLHNVAEDNM